MFLPGCGIPWSDGGDGLSIQDPETRTPDIGNEPDIATGEGWIQFTVEGEPASKANSRRLVPGTTKDGRRFTRSIKSDKALSYVEKFNAQCPVLEEPWDGPVALYCIVHYASRRPDLDCSVIEDCLQGKVIVNDRNILEKHYLKRLDKERPRTDIRIVRL